MIESFQPHITYSNLQADIQNLKLSRKRRRIRFYSKPAFRYKTNVFLFLKICATFGNTVLTEQMLPFLHYEVQS